MRGKNLHTALIVTLTALVLAACGLGSSLPPNSGGGSSATPIAGTVADGYVTGARVFLDKNANGILDPGEPNEVTGGSGTFHLSDTSVADLASYRLIAIVPKNAQDSEAGAVPNAYYLTYPKGGPDSPFISPISTLVDMKMKVSGLSLEESFASVMIELGIQLPADIGVEDALNADFVATSGIWGAANTQVAQEIHRISRVLANGLGQALDAARTIMNVAGDTADSPNPANEVQRFKLVMSNVLANLDTVAASASSLAATVSPSQNDVAAQGTVLKTVFLGTNLTTQSLVLGQVTQPLDPAVASLSLNDLPDVYAIRGRSGKQYDLARLFINTAGTTRTAASQDPITLGAAASTTASFLSTGSTGSWLVASGLFGSPWMEGAQLTLASTGGLLALADAPAFRLSVAKYNLAGKNLEYVLVNNALTTVNGFSVGGTFPSGSEAFRATFIAQEDAYMLPPGSLKTTHTSIDALLAAYPTGGPDYYAPGDGNLRMQFGAGSVGGAIWFFDAAGVRLDLDGQWQKETVRGQPLLRLAVVPDHFKIQQMGLSAQEEPFVALDIDGQARFGVMIRKGSSINFDGYLFNKTAINQINAVNGFTLVP